jgi:hypothetical protein
MKRFAPLFSALALSLALPLAGCGRPPMTSDQAMPALRSEDAETRRAAADVLRSDETNGVRPVAVPLLLAALASEPEPAVRGSILLTLGRSGAPEAESAIDDAILDDSNPHVRKVAKKAMAYWKIQNDEGPRGAWTYWVPGWRPASKVGTD